MKKVVVLKVDFNDYKGLRKVMRSVSDELGVLSICTDMEDKEVTVVGDIDPVDMVRKLRRSGWFTEIVSVNPVTE